VFSVYGLELKVKKQILQPGIQARILAISGNEILEFLEFQTPNSKLETGN
jgi:hypothetical protein